MPNFSRTTIGLFLLGLILLVVVVGTSTTGSDSSELTFPEFIAKVEAGEVQEVTFKGQMITGALDDGTEFWATGPVMHELTIYNTLTEHGVVPQYAEQSDQTLWITGFFTFVPLIIILFAFMWFMRNIQGSNGRAMQFGKSRAKLQTDGMRRVTFEDVAGIDEVREELEEIIDFLKDPRKFTRLGGRIPKGVLMMGPPGTGKTLLARAVAGEAGVPFFSISGSDFVEMFVGVGASRVRDLFENAKRQAPCIVFIDEIDAVGRHRGAGLGGGHDEREQTLNQLLVEMDGFEGTEGVIMVAATNRPDVLDPALLRPGRFDRRIVVPRPDVRGREHILAIHVRRTPLNPDVDLKTVAKQTPGFSGADLENLCNEAALIAARDNKTQVAMADFEAARDKIFMGPERRSLVMPEWEKRDTAYHEAGHAIVAHLLPEFHPVHKVSIIPRGRALGVTMYLPEEDRMSHKRSQMYAQIAVAMGGRAAEEVALNAVTSGASNDIERATQLARSMVCELGMSAELGPVNYGEGGQEVFLGRQMGRMKNYSEQTARHIDTEVRRILTTAYDSAVEILTSNVHVLHRVAQALMEQETLDHDEFARLVDEAGPVPPNNLAWMGA